MTEPDEFEIKRRELDKVLKHGKALAAVSTLLEHIGDDPSRAGLRETPERFLKAWAQEWGAGYGAPAKALVKLFKDDPKPLDYPARFDEMVLVDNISFYSHCEHHIAPFFGEAHIAYIPDERGIIGISKLVRIVHHYSRRLQVQERLTTEIAEFITHHISPDVGVVLKARHMCMMSRGVNQQHAQTITSALRGRIYSEHDTRAEFLALARQGARICD
jgi:GTP cyclohydrolase I